MLVRFKMAWHRPTAAAGDELDLREPDALRLLQRGVVEAVKHQRERAVVVEPERAVHE
mgnify:FL=1